MLKYTSILLFLVFSLQGCTNKAAYNIMRKNQQDQCLKEQSTKYFDCMERVEKPYDEYKREREELEYEK